MTNIAFRTTCCARVSRNNVQQAVEWPRFNYRYRRRRRRVRTTLSLLILYIQLYYDNLLRGMFMFYLSRRSVEAGNNEHFPCAKING